MKLKKTVKNVKTQKGGMNHAKKHFTFIEMVIVIIVLTGLAAVIIPASLRASEKGRAVSCTDRLKACGAGYAAMANDKEGKVLLVRQYRYAYSESIYEIPAGKLDKGEEPIKAAARELEEETGLISKELKLLYVMYPSPGYTNEKIYIYQAISVQEAVARPDEGEYLDAEYISLDKVKEMLASGEIKDAKTIVALQAYFLNEK